MRPPAGPPGGMGVGGGGRIVFHVALHNVADQSGGGIGCQSQRDMGGRAGDEEEERSLFGWTPFPRADAGSGGGDSARGGALA